MRFLPINLDNVKNAAALFVAIGNKEPWCASWDYSTAYARLAAIVKCVGFYGYIAMDSNGFPSGFIMGHTEVQQDGSNNFVLRELCFTKNEAGRALAADSLAHLVDELASHNILKITVSFKKSDAIADYFKQLSFVQTDDIANMELRL